MRPEVLLDRAYTSPNAQYAWTWKGDRVYLLGPNPDERLAYADTNGTVYYPHADRQGSTIALAAGGQDVLTRTYGPYGELSPAGDVTMAPGASAYPYLYTGQRFDPSLQAYDYKARIYDGKDGRFWQTDPIGSGDDLNLYSYVGEDPLDRSDPTGEQATTVSPVVVPWRPPAQPYHPSPLEGLRGGARAAGILRGGPVAVFLAATFLPSPLGVSDCRNSPTHCGFSLNENVDVTDPGSVEGATPEEVEEGAKAKGWGEQDAKSGGEKGKRFLDGSGNNGIRVMKGGGNRTGPDAGVKSGGPYAQIVGGKNAGKVIPLAGNSTLKK